MNKRPLIIIGGATATGKTALSVSLAKKINGEIISADSMQVYKGMDIGTAKITKEEMNGVSHYLIDEVPPDFDFNVFEFKSRADKYMEKIYEEGKIPVIAGGTGFYIQSVLYDIDFQNESDDFSYRHELETYDSEYLYALLKSCDEKAAELIHPNNKKRIIRALEFYNNTKTPISSHNDIQQKKESPYNYAYFVLNRNRSLIYERIEQRVDIMMENGLLEEVKKLLESGISPEEVSMQAIGYKEVISYLYGQISYDECIQLIKKNTRHYAKRQLTWFKREKEAIWINFEDYQNTEDMLSYMINILKEKEIV